MKLPIIRYAVATGFAVMLAHGYPVALADDDAHRWEDDDHAYDHARRAVERGESLPIAELLERMETQFPGEVVGVEFEREHGKWIYEFRIIDERGRLLEVEVDALTGTVLSREND